MARAGQGGQRQLQLPPLDSGPVPLHQIRSHARKSLLDLIDSRHGRKVLVLDPSLTGPLSLLDARISDLLSEHGISRLVYLNAKGPLPLDSDGPHTEPASSSAAAAAAASPRTVLFIVRATVENTQAVAAHVRAARGAAGAGARPGNGAAAAAAAGGGAPDFALFFVPRRTITCDRVLEEEGVLGDFRALGEWPLELVALEEDVVSLELAGGFKDCVLDGDSTPLFLAARALMRLQAMTGLIPRIQGKGPAAVAVKDMMLRLRRENPGALAASAGAPPRIHRLILIDREVDMVTPMMSQITFEGLIDEVTGIKAGVVPWVPKDKRAAGQGQAGGPGGAAGGAGGGGGTAAGGSTLLNSTDPYYEELRDLPYHMAITRLQAAAREARREYAELESKDLAGLKSFVKGLPKLMLLDRLSDVAAPVAEQVRQQLFHDRLRHELDCVEGVDVDAAAAFAEELLSRGAELLDVLRLAVLMNETGHGLPRKALEGLRAGVLEAHGYGHALTLGALERAGFLRQAAPGRSPFSSVRKAFRLVVAEPEGTPPDAPPTDISHIYKGYAPLSVRLVEQALLKGGWAPVADALSALPGSHFDVMQASDAEGRPVDRAVGRGGPGGAGAAGAAAGGVGSSGGTQQGIDAAGLDSAAAAGAPAGVSAGGAAGGRDRQAGAGSGPAGPPPWAPTGSTSDLAGAAAQGYGGSGQGGETVMVAFLGGVTYSEISALRFLSTRPECAHRFVVLTTEIVNGRSLLSGFVDPAVSRLSGAVGLQQL